MIDTLVGAGFRVKKCCEVLGVSSAGYYLAKTRPMSPTKIRREWLTGLIREVHAVSRGTYRSRRVHAELTKGRGVHVSRVLVTILMHDAEIAGIPGPRKVKRIKGNPTSDDLVQRKFERSSLDELWSRTSRSTRREKARSIAAAYSTRAADASWAGPLTRLRTRRSLSTRSTWPSSNAA